MPEPARDPAVSVVIVSRAGGPDLLACLEAFAHAVDEETELIVAECAPPDTPDRIRAAFPRVRVLHDPDRRALPDLRAAGMQAARGGIIALTSDRCRPAEGWLGALRRVHRSSDAVAIGGALQPARAAGLVERAFFLSEYGRYLPQCAAGGETTDLPAQNVSYKRQALDALAGLLAPAVWEPLWHWRLQARGLRLQRDSSIVLTLHRRGSLLSFLGERYHYARSFAGQRLQGTSLPYRSAYAAAAPLLPVLFLGRLARDLWWRGGDRRAFVRCLPYLGLFAVAGAAGECAGALAGPGTSGQRID
jgi:hypothetical protein